MLSTHITSSLHLALLSQELLSAVSLLNSPCRVQPVDSERFFTLQADRCDCPQDPVSGGISFVVGEGNACEPEYPWIMEKPGFLLLLLILLPLLFFIFPLPLCSSIKFSCPRLKHSDAEICL